MGKRAGSYDHYIDIIRSSEINNNNRCRVISYSAQGRAKLDLVKLYVCRTTSGPDLHPCAKAYRALIIAGYEPEVEIVKGTGRLPRVFDPITRTAGRAKVEKLTGDIRVPALEIEDGSGIAGCQLIIDWSQSDSC